MSANTTTTAFTTKLRKFDRTGYRVWARQLQLYLEVKDVWSAVLKPAPTSLHLENEGSDQAERPLRQQERPLHQLELQQKLAMTIILSALTDDQAALVADLQHPKDMLAALQKTHRHVCDTAVGALKRDLGPDWNGYIGSLETCASMEELLIKASAEARRRTAQTQRGKSGGTQTARGGTAFTATAHGKSGVKKGKCFNCGKCGHFKNECKSKRLGGTSGHAATSDQDGNEDAESGFVFQVSSTPESAEADWIIDSRASSHMTGSPDLLNDLIKMASDIVVTTASGMKLSATHRGTASLPLVSGGICTLDNVLYVPGPQRNLVSLSKVGAAGLTATFTREHCVITSGHDKLVATRRSNGLYIVSAYGTRYYAEVGYASGDQPDDLAVWHAKMGHLNARDLKLVLKASDVTTRNSQLLPCESCAAGKLASVPFLAKKPRDPKRGQVLIAIDYVGPMETTSRDGYTGMVSTIIESYHLTAVFPVKDKSLATQLSALRECIAYLKVAAQNASVAVLKSDNAAEYVGGEIAEFCNENMIAQEFSTPHTPQQNGKVERSNRVVVEMARTMLQAAGMGKRFWSDGVLAAGYIRNRYPTKVLGGKSPIEVVTGRTPVLHKLRVFGCYADVLLPKSQRHKLDTKTVNAIFIGYEKSGGSQWSRGGSGSVIFSMTAVFFESSEPRSRTATLDGEMPPQVQAESASKVVPNQLDTIQEDTEMDDADSNQSSSDVQEQRLVDPRAEKQLVRRSTRVKKKPAPILALAVQLHWGHLQLDVQTAFLNSDLDEVIFITPPTETGDDKVWKLRKALYGLKQASRAWYETVTKFLCQAGFAQCQPDSCVLVKRTANSIVVVMLYVDDMLIFSDVASELAAFQANITSRFAINKCDVSSSSVGMGLTWSKAGDMLTIGQQKYTAIVVNRFASSDDRSRPRTPMDSNFQHQVADDMQTIGEPIRPAVGSLLYASTVSRPDLTTVVRLIAQETEQPTSTVQTAIGRVLGYLARTADMGMVYRRSTNRELQLEVYCDAAFACERERKLSTGFVVFLNGCCISWGSKKQQIVTLSTTESESVALAHGIKECIGLKQLLLELGFDVDKVLAHEDSQAAQHVAEGKGVSQRSRHIDLHYHWIREKVQCGSVSDLCAEELEAEMAILPDLSLTAEVRIEDLKVGQATGVDPEVAAHEGKRLRQIIWKRRKWLIGKGEPERPGTHSVLGRRSYIDDILIGGKSWDDLCEKVERLLDVCEQWHLSISVEKSEWGMYQVDYLGHKVSQHGLQANTKNLESLTTLEFPHASKGLQSFLDSLKYYHRFIPDFAILKSKLAMTSMLKHFDAEQEPVVIVYANDWTIAAVLAQIHDDVCMPVKFTSRTLKPNELNYNIVEKKVLALLRVLNECLTMPSGRTVRVLTRPTALAWLFRSKGLQGRLSQWAAAMAPWILEIYRSVKGEEEILGTLAASITPREFVDAALEEISPQKRPSRMDRGDPSP
ncbi:unnamed protein product [Phytophthora fragariaefolia]|uniref:Unnamed protein product n=1 Tax=Phytophthora fragariaefolia TaxID=1490495 RepID=A0A9W6XTJ7_9STRA|nr:unnamed protein product [Phytophthora fragariaefolia]